MYSYKNIDEMIRFSSFKEAGTENLNLDELGYIEYIGDIIIYLNDGNKIPTNNLTMNRVDCTYTVTHTTDSGKISKRNETIPTGNVKYIAEKKII